MHKTGQSHLLSFIGDFGDAFGGAIIGYSIAPSTRYDGLTISIGTILIIISILVRRFKK